MDEEETFLPTVPVSPDHAYDLPPDQHVGHAAALHVPCSQGPADYELRRPAVSDRALIEEEPRVEPGRLMEAEPERGA
jgi:hypothetical protein